MSKTVGETLKDIRVKLGFASARSFYIDLSKRSELSFNYSYYMKIEADSLSPSEKIISQMATLLPEPDGDALVAAYCSSMFPKQMKRLLDEKKIETTPKAKKAAKKSPEHIRSHQEVLTEKQIATIATSKSHYFLFLIMTLSRGGILKKDLKKYSFSKLDECFADLEAAKLIFTEEEQYFPSYPEYLFPKSDTASLKKLYQKLDEYDLSRNEFFGLSKEKNVSFFKRISPRQASNLILHMDLLFQTIRTADELDTSYNSEVLSFNMTYYQGKIVG